MEDQESEFGKGFIYNLILFAKHWAMEERYLETSKDFSLWFNCSSDHFYELEIPEKWKDHEIGKIALFLRDRSLELGHGFKKDATKEDYEEVFNKLERLGMLIDKELGIEPIEAQWN